MVIQEPTMNIMVALGEVQPYPVYRVLLRTKQVRTLLLSNVLHLALWASHY